MRTSTAHELTAPLGSVHAGRLVFTRGVSNLTIVVDASMDELYRARFDGRMPEVGVHGGTVTVRYRPSLLPSRGEITLSGLVRGTSRAGGGCRTSWRISRTWTSEAW